jgi:DNA-directed RNA polymerase specialized sigma24 family protein
MVREEVCGMGTPERPVGGGESKEARKSVRSASGVDGAPVASQADPESARDIEPAASRLAIRFLRQDDGTAFESLVRVAVPCLTARAHAATRRVGLAIAPETIVAELMTAIFLEADEGTAVEIGRTGFVAVAEAGFRRIMTRHMERLSRGKLQSRDERECAASLVDTTAFVQLAGVAGCTSGEGLRADRESDAEPGSIECDDARAAFAAAFHRLALDERRALLLIDVDGLDPGGIAPQVGVSEAGAMSLVEQAREALAAALQVALRELHPEPAAGEGQLGDLLYELIKAALVLDEDLRRRIHYWEEPRNIRTVEDELRSRTWSRRASFVRRILSEYPGGLGGADGLLVARLSIAVLQQVEGRSARQRLANGVLMIAERRPADALRELEPMLAEMLPHAYRVSVARNVMWALGRQGNFHRAFELGRGFVIEYPDDPLLNFNMAVVAAHLGRRDVFFDMAAKMHGNWRKGGTDATRLERLIRFEVPRFADDVGLTVREVEVAFGLDCTDGPREVAQT